MGLQVGKRGAYYDDGETTVACDIVREMIGVDILCDVQPLHTVEQ